MTATTNTRPYHHMPDLVAQIGAAYVRINDIQHWIPTDELPMFIAERIHTLLRSADGLLYRAADFFSHEEGDDVAFCREEISLRLQESHRYMDEALDLFRNSDYYREHSRWGWDAFVARVTFIPDHA